MTPTLEGRWQTRLLLTFVIGLPVAIIYGLMIKSIGITLFAVVLMLLFGFIWELSYHYLQHRRWDADWPPLYAIGAGLAEGLYLWLIMSALFSVTMKEFIAMYGVIWLLMFLVQLGPLNIFFPYRRFRGGRIWAK